MTSYTRSHDLYTRACGSLAGGVSSEFRKDGYPHPLFYERAAGSHVFDVDGNDYLDFALSQGPMILGHSHSHVLDCVAKRSAQGQLYAGQHLQEIELAETIQRLVPCAELMRFGLSGSEADHAALRLARAVTRRPKFLRFEGHYHGWLDSVASGVTAASPDALGPRDRPNLVPWTEGLPDGYADDVVVLPWNDLDLLRETLHSRGNEIAAVITEPMMCNAGGIPPADGFLAGLRDACDKAGCLLIFDEVITGFRLAPGGAQQHFGVVPDLAVFGKALASGYPISVLAGKREVMQPIADGKVIHAGTMNSGVPSVAAAMATLEILERDGVHERIFALGQRLAAGLRDAAGRAGQPLLVQGIGPVQHAGFTELPAVREMRDTFHYDKEKYGRFVAAMHDRGIRLIGRGIWYVSSAHTEAEVDHAVATAGEVLSTLD